MIPVSAEVEKNIKSVVYRLYNTLIYIEICIQNLIKPRFFFYLKSREI